MHSIMLGFAIRCGATMTPLAKAALSLALLALFACKAEKPEPEVVLAQMEVPTGVTPDTFECPSVASMAAVKQALGSFEVTQSPFPAPDGVPDPCHYRTLGDAGAQSFSFDIDCRKTAIEDAQTLMVQWSQSGDSVPLSIGKSAIDHRNTALLFIDDDTPCYVRVVGPRSSARRELARVVAQGLTPQTAPLAAPVSR